MKLICPICEKVLLSQQDGITKVHGVDIGSVSSSMDFNGVNIIGLSEDTFKCKVCDVAPVEDTE